MTTSVFLLTISSSCQTQNFLKKERGGVGVCGVSKILSSFCPDGLWDSWRAFTQTWGKKCLQLFPQIMSFLYMFCKTRFLKSYPTLSNTNAITLMKIINNSLVFSFTV